MNRIKTFFLLLELNSISLVIFYCSCVKHLFSISDSLVEEMVRLENDNWTNSKNKPEPVKYILRRCIKYSPSA